jgi:hypothetical protein
MEGFVEYVCSVNKNSEVIHSERVKLCGRFIKPEFIQ